MSEQPLQLQLGFRRENQTHFFMCYGHVWAATMYWCASSHKPDSFVSDYSGDVYYSSLRKEMEDLGKLTISAVRLTPSRFRKITDLEKPFIARDDIKGAVNDTKPWFFRKAIPPVLFTSTFYAWDDGGKWQTTFVDASSDGKTTQSQRDWIKDNILGPLNSCFTFGDRTEFLQEAKAAAAGQWKDRLMEKAMQRMAHFRSLVECIETNYDTLIP